MSKSYNERYQYKKNRPTFEYPNGFQQKYSNDIQPGETKTYDWSHTTIDRTNGLGHEITLMNCRHPNKRKHRKLIKEFKLVKTWYLGNFDMFDNRHGDTDSRRRTKSVKRIENEKRRFQLKKQTNKLIEESINEINN